MDILESRQKDIVILTIHGRFDATTAPVFDEKLLFMLEQGEKNFLLDFEHLEYVSSAALRLLLLLAKNAEMAGGKVVFASLRRPILKVFEIAGFINLFPIYPSLAEAVASF